MKKRYFNSCTYLIENEHQDVYYPRSIFDLKSKLKYCIENNLDYHVCSRGKNWGYGSKVGHKNNTLLFDLSKMQNIEINEVHATATIEAGVTQKLLYDTLKELDSNLMLPVTGSSEDSSILGNALGLGYANGKRTIRFDSLLQLDGFNQKGNFINGVDSQSTCKYQHNSSLELSAENAVITRAKISLPQIPNHVLMVSFSIQSDKKLEALIHRLDQYKKQGLIEGNWSLFSAHRLIAESNRKCELQKDKDKIISDDQAMEILKDKYGYKIWTGKFNGVFACYMPAKQILDSIGDFLKKDLTPFVDQIHFLDVSKNQIRAERNGEDVYESFPVEGPIKSRLRTFTGILKNGSMDISYWKKNKLTKDKQLEEDKCGFIWGAFSASLDASTINEAIKMIKESMFKNGFEPIFVIDGVFEHEVYIMVSIIFDYSNVVESQVANKLYHELSKALSQIGIVNFRRPSTVKKFPGAIVVPHKKAA